MNKPSLIQRYMNYNTGTDVGLEKKRGSFPLCCQLFEHSGLQEVLSMLTNAAQQVASGGILQTFYQLILHKIKALK